LDIWNYVLIVYGVAAALLVLVIALHPGVHLTGYGRNDWLVFAALALGPMLIGHTGVNYALRYLPAFVANLAILGEPVGATLIAWLLPGIREVPGIQTIVGGAVLLTGILLGAMRPQRRTYTLGRPLPRWLSLADDVFFLTGGVGVGTRAGRSQAWWSGRIAPHRKRCGRGRHRAAACAGRRRRARDVRTVGDQAAPGAAARR